MILIWAALGAACFSTPGVARPPADGSSRWAQAGEVAPEIALPALDGSAFRLSSHAGQVVVVSFWATSCVYCREELPELEALRARHPDGLVVVAVSLDDADGDDAVQEAAAQMHLRFPMLRDPEGRAAFAYMKMTAVPLTAIVGRDGKLFAVHHGYAPALVPLLEKEVQTALADAP